jgi:thiosulfate/3-mercaptopyruvate sulfurtransferase
VVIYDDMGGLNAARLFWELERIGHPRVSVLDGGLVQWVLDGRRVTANSARPAPVAYEGGGGGRANEAVLADVRAAGARLLDVRSREEYAGEPRDPRGGHIPGAHWWVWDSAIDLENGFRLRPAETLSTSLAQAGVTDPTAPLIAYCRSGHRASHTYLALRLLGYRDVRVYDGSMAEYGLDRGAPLARGMRP